MLRGEDDLTNFGYGFAFITVFGAVIMAIYTSGASVDIAIAKGSNTIEALDAAHVIKGCLQKIGNDDAFDHQFDLIIESCHFPRKIAITLTDTDTGKVWKTGSVGKGTSQTIPMVIQSGDERHRGELYVKI